MQRLGGFGETRGWVDGFSDAADDFGLADLDVIAEELSSLGEKVRSLERRVAETERVNARLEEAALTTSRALQEISRHWDAVHEAMRRAELVDDEEKLA